MTATRLKEKVSTLVRSQLPEFIQSDYSTFVSFLEAYYEFLEQDKNAQEVIQNARSYNDIDQTVNEFVQYFLSQYCQNIPRNNEVDEKLLIKNIGDLYQNKGTPKAYALLFRILFNKNIEIFYPGTQVLKASDGKWVQKTSIFVSVQVGNSDLIVNKKVLVTSSVGTQYYINVESKRPAFNSTGAVPNTFEYFFDDTQNIPINVGDVLEFGNFKGTVVSVPAIVSIKTPGAGFKVGDILTLTSGQGNGAKLKVTKVNSTGGVLAAQFITFGLGYTGEFYNFFSSVDSTITASSFSYLSGNATISDNTSGFVERGSITRSDYATSYFASDYQGTILREFFTSTTPNAKAPLGSANDVAVYIQLGSKVKYPGYYQNVDGFLSDTIYLEDRDYYQPFTYVIKIDERLESYKKAVLDIVHPAGTKLIGQLTLNNDLDISGDITAIMRFLASHFTASIRVSDSNAKDVLKNLVDAITAEDSTVIDVNKPLVDSAVALEAYVLDFYKNTVELVNVIESDAKDFFKNFGAYTFYTADPTYFQSEYVAGVLEVSPGDAVSLTDLFEGILGRELYDDFVVVETSNVEVGVNIFDNTDTPLDGNLFFSINPVFDSTSQPIEALNYDLGKSLLTNSNIPSDALSFDGVFNSLSSATFGTASNTAVDVSAAFIDVTQLPEDETNVALDLNYVSSATTADDPSVFNVIKSLATQSNIPVDELSYSGNFNSLASQTQGTESTVALEYSSNIESTAATLSTTFYDYTKNLTSVSNLVTDDAPVMDIGQGLANVFGTADSSQLDIINNFVDLGQALDSGTILFSDYAIDYFAEDYVGVIIQVF